MPHSMTPFPMIDFSDVVVHDDLPSRQEVMEVHDPEHYHHMHDEHSHLLTDPEENSLVLEIPEGATVEHYDGELSDEGLPEEVDLVVKTDDDETILGIDLGDLPGAPPGTLDPEVDEDLVVEESENSEESSSDKSDARDSKKDKWDWKSYGFGQFTIWVKERFDNVPKHTGYDIAGLERAHAYLEKLHGEISRAMRSDLDGELDANLVAELHDKIEEGLEKLEDRIKKVKKSKSHKKAELSVGLVKEAQKIFGVQSGVVITVPLFISSLARVLVTGMVSSGKDIEDNYNKLVKKYKLSDRERMELIQLLQDMGVPMLRDRGLMPEDEFDLRSTDNPEYPANYQA